MIDLRKAEIAYCIRKPITSRTRREREREFLPSRADPSLRATYFRPPARRPSRASLSPCSTAARL